MTDQEVETALEQLIDKLARLELATSKHGSCPTCGNPASDPKESQIGLNEFKSCEDEFHN